MTLEAIKYCNGKVEILDQLLLPHETKYIPVNNTEDGWNVIQKMQVKKWSIISLLWVGVDIYKMK